MDIQSLESLLRLGVYAATVAAAGSALFSLSFPELAPRIARTLQRQMGLGIVLLFLLEPARYTLFQYKISGGDLGLAFGPDLRWLGMATPIGQASIVRLFAGLALFLFSKNSRIVQLGASAVMIGSYLLEGHTSASDHRLYLAPLLFLHLVIAHWWLGALYPLSALTRSAGGSVSLNGFEAFGMKAIYAVPVLIAAGATIFALLTGFKLDFANVYQQRFLIKLGLVVVILGIAARNKFTLTPMLARAPKEGGGALKRSIAIEIVVAAAILATTAWILQTGPDE